MISVGYGDNPGSPSEKRLAADAHAVWQYTTQTRGISADRLILLVAQRNPETAEPDPDDLHRVGTIAMVMRSLRMPDGRLKVLVQGLGKARIESVIEHDASTWVRIVRLPTEPSFVWHTPARS